MVCDEDRISYHVCGENKDVIECAEDKDLNVCGEVQILCYMWNWKPDISVSKT